MAEGAKLQGASFTPSGPESGPQAKAVLTPLDWCGDELRRLDPDRWMTALFAPEGLKRNSLFALYAFNLELTRIQTQVREPMLGQIRLQWWRETIEAALAGTPREQPLARAMAELRSVFDASDLISLIDAREREFEVEPPSDFGALQAYCAGTSSALMGIAAKILAGSAETSLAEACHNGGIAYGLCGLLRALPLHVARGRVWLPNDMLARDGIAADDLRQMQFDDRIRRIVGEISSLARQHLSDARAAARSAPKSALPALLPIRLASLYLDRLAGAAHDVEHPANRISVPRRQMSVWWGATIGRI